MDNLSGRVAVVTGAAGGIGLAMATKPIKTINKHKGIKCKKK